VTLLHALVIALAGMAAGAINAVVGSGTLITFPTLLALGYPAVVANVSNTVGLVPGTAAGVIGYRKELAGRGRYLRRLGPASIAGGVTGGVLLLALPASAFRTIVPVLIGISVVLVVAQPWLATHLPARDSPTRWATVALVVGVFLAGVYGGYFGAAQGVLLIGILGLGLAEPIQNINAIKNVLAGLVNLVAAVLFIVVSDVDWAVAALIAAGSIAGGFVGASVGRRLPSIVLRGVIVVVGVVAMVALLT
jgi:uncharacterized membrane protein YfcA